MNDKKCASINKCFLIIMVSLTLGKRTFCTSLSSSLNFFFFLPVMSHRSCLKSILNAPDCGSTLNDDSLYRWRR